MFEGEKRKNRSRIITQIQKFIFFLECSEPRPYHIHYVLIPLVSLKCKSSVTTLNDLVIIAVAAIIESDVGSLECLHLSRAAIFAISVSRFTISKPNWL
jgi:hypothetical protein